MRNSNRKWLAVALAVAAAGALVFWLGPVPHGWLPGDSSPATLPVTVAGPLASAELVTPLTIRGRLPDLPALPPVGSPTNAAVESSFLAGAIGAPRAATGPEVAPIGFRGAPETVQPEHASAPAAGATVRRGRGAGVLRVPAASLGDLSNDLIRRMIGGKRGSLEACYWRAQSADPTLAGDVTFFVTVKPSGSVDVAVGDESPRLAAAGVTRCIKSRLESLDFAGTPPAGGDFQLRLPMTFIEAPPPPPPEI